MEVTTKWDLAELEINSISIEFHVDKKWKELR
jgi:hypothetical protein